MGIRVSYDIHIWKCGIIESIYGNEHITESICGNLTFTETIYGRIDVFSHESIYKKVCLSLSLYMGL